MKKKRLDRGLDRRQAVPDAEVALAEIKPRGSMLAQRRAKLRWNPHLGMLLALVALFLLPLFSFMNANNISLVSLCLVYLMAVIGLNAVFGFAGQVTLGPAAVFAVGAYVAAMINVNLGLGFIWSVVIGTACATVSGLVIGLPALRVSGFYLAMVTALAANAIPSIVLLFPAATGGENGIIGVSPLAIGGSESAATGLRILAVFAVLTAWLARNLLKGCWGRWFRLVASGDTRAAVVGMSPYRLKLLSFVISATFGGLAGTMFAHLQQVVSPDSFGFQLSIDLFVMIVLGGLGTFWGPVLGVVIYVVLPFYFLPSSGGPWVQVGYGAALILVMILIPGGAAGGFRQLITTALNRLRPPTSLSALQAGDRTAVSQSDQSNRSDKDQKVCFDLASPPGVRLMSRPWYAVKYRSGTGGSWHYAAWS